MMYEEFCMGVGTRVDRKCYERIEAVYMAFDRFGSKQDLYDFFLAHDMNGIEALYEELHAFKQHLERRDALQARIDKLQSEMAALVRDLNVVSGFARNRALLCGIRAA